MKKVMCAKCGGAMKKMQKGGASKSFIAGIPNGGPTGPNYQGIDTMKKGGAIKKMQDGGKVKTVVKKAKSTDPYPMAVKGYQMKMDGLTMKQKGELMKAKGEAMKKEGASKKMAKGGSTFGMLSVKAGIDKNPKPTAADRIAGAKMSKKKMGGSIKKKK